MGKKKIEIPWWRTHFGEEEIQHVIDSIHNEHISQGPVTAGFEKQIAETLNVPYVVACTNGSVALLMALMAVGVKPGDEVIVSNRTWIATAHAPLILGAKTVLVDVEPDRPIIDANRIEEKITPKTKVIIPVHLNGRSAKMKEINRIAEKYGITVIEDAAQAFCSINEDGFLGCQSSIGCFSLSIPKLISTGQGGFLVTKNHQIYEWLNLMRTHGVADLVNSSFTKLGFNFRFTDILASIGIQQLRKLDDRIKKVEAVYHKYENELHQFSFVTLIPVNIDSGEIPIYVDILCSKRDELMKFLSDRDIQTRPFYPNLETANYFECEVSYQQHLHLIAECIV